MTGNIAKTDLQAEYEHALQVAKALATEYQNAAPDHLKERIKKAILYAYDVLVMMDTPKHQIVSKLYEDFDHFYTDRHIRNIIKEADPSIDQPEGEELENGNFSENISSIFCYKHNAYHTRAEFEEENARFAKMARANKEFWAGIETKCSQQHMESLLPEPLKTEGLYLGTKNPKHDGQEWDGRQDVSERNFPKFIKAVLAANDRATELFIKWMKDWKPLTGKQEHKLTHGRATICHPYFQPQTAEEAQELHFHGGECVFKYCLDCEKREKEQARRRVDANGNPLSNDKVNINSRADAAKCRKCGSTNLVEKGCHERRLMFGVEAVPTLYVKCAHCHEEFPPLPNKLPVQTGIQMP